MNTTKLAEWATISAAVIGGLWWLFALESRVTQLEKAGSHVSQSPSQGSGLPQSSVSPFEQACADIARKAADLIALGQFVEAGQIQSQLKSMGCQPSKPNSN